MRSVAALDLDPRGWLRAFNVRRANDAGFLYIASVSVIPELLAESRSAKQALKEVGWQHALQSAREQC